MYSSNILKGGALLEDTRRFVEVWDDELARDENLDRILRLNLLGHPSRKRAADVLKYVMKRRFLEGADNCIPALRAMQSHPSAFREACYYEAARSDGLLATFAEGPLFGWYSDGRVGVNVRDTEVWLRGLIARAQLPQWSDQVVTRAAQGLLSTLRDFGVLNGAVRKEYSAPGISAQGFAYVAFREQQQGVSARGLVESTVWRRWLLDARWVNDLLTQADRLGLLHYARAGSAVRIDWRLHDLGEVVRAAA
jgi:hypothetical protein